MNASLAMVIWCSITLSAMLGLAEATPSQQHVQAVAAEGNTVLTVASAHGPKVKVVIRQMRLKEPYSYRGALFWGGDIDELPKTIVIGLDVSEDGRLIFVPMSAYVDLGNVHHAFIAATKRGFTLHLNGGDAAGSYTATFSFRGDCIAKRTVRSAEFPDQSWEYTQYSAVSKTSSRESCGSDGDQSTRRD